MSLKVKHENRTDKLVQKPLKVKTTKQPDDNNILQPEIVKEEIKTDNEPKQQTTGNSIFDDFETFQRTQTEFKPDDNDTGQLKTVQQSTNNVSAPVTQQNVYVANIEEKTKLRMFLGFACFLLAGLNTFILNKIKGTKVPMEKMELNDGQIDSLLIYLDDPKIYEFINKIPGWVIGIAHMEFMFYNNHKMVTDQYKPKLEKE